MHQGRSYLWAARHHAGRGVVQEERLHVALALDFAHATVFEIEAVVEEAEGRLGDDYTLGLVHAYTLSPVSALLSGVHRPHWQPGIAQNHEEVDI